MVEQLSSNSHHPETINPKVEVKNFNFYYGDFHAIKNVTFTVPHQKVTALIGPSGCGKTTLLRCFNRLHDLYPGNRYQGEIRIDSLNILSPTVDPIEVRMRVSMVFQKPNPFPKSIYENVVYGLRVRGEKNRSILDEKVEKALQNAALWDEVKDRLHKSAYDLSGGQQQRLCIARALVTEPEVILLDEPTSALDPIATNSIEKLVSQLQEKVTMIIVTHSMQQAARISDYIAFMYLGEMIEFGETQAIFSNPEDQKTQDYISGRIG